MDNPFKYQDKEYDVQTEPVSGLIVWGSLVYVAISTMVLIGCLIFAFTN